jgi:hypothetical protein
MAGRRLQQENPGGFADKTVAISGDFPCTCNYRGVQILYSAGELSGNSFPTLIAQRQEIAII